jgi:hypothetical protein
MSGSRFDPTNRIGKLTSPRQVAKITFDLHQDGGSRKDYNRRGTEIDPHGCSERK